MGKIQQEQVTSRVLKTLRFFPNVECSVCPHAIWYIEGKGDSTEEAEQKPEDGKLKLYCRIFDEHLEKSVIFCDGFHMEQGLEP